jgi:hypothetical protein
LKIERVGIAPQIHRHPARHESLLIEQVLACGSVDIEVELRGVAAVAVLTQHVT